MRGNNRCENVLPPKGKRYTDTLQFSPWQRQRTRRRDRKKPADDEARTLFNAKRGPIFESLKSNKKRMEQGEESS